MIYQTVFDLTNCLGLNAAAILNAYSVALEDLCIDAGVELNDLRAAFVKAEEQYAPPVNCIVPFSRSI